MFDGEWPEELAGMVPGQLGVMVEQNAVALRAREARCLVLAAAWADAHESPVGSPYGPVVERSCYYGGAGTPEVAEFCAAEFGTLQGLSFSVARAMIGDALDLRHRLPVLWRQARAGKVRAWKAQKFAQATRQLGFDAAAEVDAAISGLVEAVPWPRFEKILAAAVVDADPDLAAERAERARTTRRVWASDAGGRVEDPGREGRRRGCHLVLGGGEPDRRHLAGPRRCRPGGSSPRQGRWDPGPAGGSPAAALRAPGQTPTPQPANRSSPTTHRPRIWTCSTASSRTSTPRSPSRRREPRVISLRRRRSTSSRPSTTRRARRRRIRSRRRSGRTPVWG